MDINTIDKKKLSPMMQQYMSVKEKYPDHIIFFRLGDFYEMFFEDAKVVSKVLELTLTGRDCGLEERAPMCGVPHHSSEIYLKKLVENGFKVAICEQLTDPASTKGIVERDIVRIVTAGTIIESSMLDECSNNYICSVYFKENECAVCFADISTGEVMVSVKSGKEVCNDVIEELAGKNPSEIIFNSAFAKLSPAMDFINSKLKCSVSLRNDNCFDTHQNEKAVLSQFSADDYAALGLSHDTSVCSAVCGLFNYIGETQKSLVGRFMDIDVRCDSNFMGLCLTARRNLELTETLRNKERKGSLLWVLDNACTSMGKRLLKSQIEQPLLSPAKIIERLDAVEILTKKSVVLSDIRDILGNVYDLERLMTRVMYKTANPRDLKSLSITAGNLPLLKKNLSLLTESKLLKRLDDKISSLEEIANLVENAIVDNPPVSLKDGGIIKEGFNKELDKIREIKDNGKKFIEDIVVRERERTGIKNLKTGYNNVFGYYIEVTRSYYDLVPNDYVRKQTLANSERFITDELKKAENTVLGANERALSLENEIFCEIRDYLAGKLRQVQDTASALAQVDMLCSFAQTAIKNQYIKPEIAIDGITDIKDGRHPVVELMLNDGVFVPNDTYLDTGQNRMSIITGPNMSGKSTYMRQTALITIMAQIGSFVPARYAKISIADKIFTRIGASDDLTAGQSTFMVEMSEVADILKHATKKSLVILDEVGRGTSTFDGISIAKATAEHICNAGNLGCRTLFATHYHELISLENENSGIKNYRVAVKKHGDDIRFLRKIVRGGVDDSYGIEVAKLAGLPQRVINRAREILSEMESQSENTGETNYSDSQLDFSIVNNEVIADKLRKTNINELSDTECREMLQELIKLI